MDKGKLANQLILGYGHLAKAETREGIKRLQRA